MASRHRMETKLDELITQSTPNLPDGAKRTLVSWMPGAAAVIGALSLLSAWILFNFAYAGGSLTGDCNAYTVAGCGNWQASRFSIWLWLSIALVATQGLLFLFSIPFLYFRRRFGWLIMYYTVWIGVGYAGASLLSSLDAFGRSISALVGAAIGMYFLFQVRDFYPVRRHAVVRVWRNPDDHDRQ